jgi:putative endonuclease
VSDARRRLGAAGEDAVAAWYTERGHRILDRNWRVREGEIDLVVAVGDRLVVCEVKARSGSGFGHPFEAVDHRKQRRLRRLALRYLDEHPGLRGRPLRFDVAAVTPTGIEVLEAAF